MYCGKSFLPNDGLLKYSDGSSNARCFLAILANCYGFYFFGFRELYHKIFRLTTVCWLSTLAKLTQKRQLPASLLIKQHIPLDWWSSKPKFNYTTVQKDLRFLLGDPEQDVTGKFAVQKVPDNLDPDKYVNIEIS